MTSTDGNDVKDDDDGKECNGATSTPLEFD